jgi:hypothetical protein
MSDITHYLVNNLGHLTPEGYKPVKLLREYEFASEHFHSAQDVLNESRTRQSLTQFLSCLCKEVLGILPEGWGDEPETIVRNWFLVLGGEQEKMVIRKANEWLGEEPNLNADSEDFIVDDDIDDDIDDGGSAVAYAYFLHETYATEVLNIELTDDDETGDGVQKVILKHSVDEANEIAKRHGLPLDFKRQNSA